MTSVDMQFVRNRNREVRRVVHRSSPLLLYSGSRGIFIIAANKSAVRYRIGKILDRMAIVSRGEISASDIAHKVAAAEAYSLAHLLSRGDVLGHEPTQAVSALITRHHHAFLAEPLAVESCLVQLNASPEDDYMAHVDCEGSIQLFDRILYLGEVEKDSHLASSSNESRDGSDTDPDHTTSRETLNKLNRNLHEQWVDHPNIESLVGALKQFSAISPLFTIGKRRDVVLLNRDRLFKHDYGAIFERLTLV